MVAVFTTVSRAEEPFALNSCWFHIQWCKTKNVIAALL